MNGEKKSRRIVAFSYLKDCACMAAASSPSIVVVAVGAIVAAAFVDGIVSLCMCVLSRQAVARQHAAVWPRCGHIEIQQERRFQRCDRSTTTAIVAAAAAVAAVADAVAD